MTYDEIKIREKGRHVAEEHVADIYKFLNDFEDPLHSDEPADELLDVLEDCFLAGYRQKEYELEEYKN